MSDKTSDKYRITLTHKQFDLICHAVDMMGVRPVFLIAEGNT